MKKRAGDPWMEPPAYARTLRGFNVNLIVRDVAPSVAFQRDVLGAEVVYSDADLAVLCHDGHEWMVHAAHAYANEAGESMPFLTHTQATSTRGGGVELRLYGIDPDAAEARARARGDRVLAESSDKPHGLRECYLVDPDGYVWVPGIAPNA
jgi:catechol 2,3-dioxygenase-like lactoylglutathione lyase family enzyme